MTAAIIGLLGTLASIVWFFIKRNDRKKTPNEIHNDDIQEFNEHLSNGDGLGVSADFERMRLEVKKGDRGDSGGSGDEESAER